MVRVGLIVPCQPFLSPFTAPPAFPRAPTRHPQPQISLQVWTWLGQDWGLGSRHSGHAQLPQPLPRPRCPLTGPSVAGPGPFPTDTARPARLQDGCLCLHPVFLAALLLPGLLFSEGPWWARGQTPLSGQPWGGEGTSPPGLLLCSHPLFPVSRLWLPVLPPHPPPSERLWPRVLVGTGSQRGGWGFRAWVSASCPAPTPHPEEVSVRTRASGDLGCRTRCREAWPPASPGPGRMVQGHHGPRTSSLGPGPGGSLTLLPEHLLHARPASLCPSLAAAPGVCVPPRGGVWLTQV